MAIRISLEASGRACFGLGEKGILNLSDIFLVYVRKTKSCYAFLNRVTSFEDHQSQLSLDFTAS